ncbi:phosphate-starvation-inducible PsiE family protein [Rhodopila sp.]|uniref:phosphate-starvation-inducible PsiE family protein n=1 Tax=Rhodopila sp. TaxID=2480087 RepID=UPI003D0B163E
MDTDEANEKIAWRPFSTRIFVQAEHGLYVALAVLLCATSIVVILGAAVTLWTGLGDWTATNTVFVVIDRLLVVLMLVEILHTVLVSVRSGALTCEPFLIVGLIASIRRILVITLETSQTTQQGNMSNEAMRTFHNSMIELGVLAVLILVMVASIYMLRRVDPVSTEQGPDETAIKT